MGGVGEGWLDNYSNNCMLSFFNSTHKFFHGK